jgi:hypothetical protein
LHAAVTAAPATPSMPSASRRLSRLRSFWLMTQG